MRDSDTIEVKASEVCVGDLADLEGGPYFRDDPSLEFELATVVQVERETPDCILIGFEGVGAAGYDPDQLIPIRRRDLFPAGYWDQF